MLRLTACRPLFPGLQIVDLVVILDDVDVNVDFGVEMSAGMIVNDFDFNERNC